MSDVVPVTESTRREAGWCEKHEKHDCECPSLPPMSGEVFVESYSSGSKEEDPEAETGSCPTPTLPESLPSAIPSSTPSFSRNSSVAFTEFELETLAMLLTPPSGDAWDALNRHFILLSRGAYHHA